MITKNIEIVFLYDAQKEYKKLKEVVKEQRKQNTKEIQLLKSINQKVNFIKANPFYGDNIPKKYIPNEYNFQNLWRVELCHFWRMLYTIKGDQIEIICFILDILDHSRYNKKFGYKKK